MGGGILDILTYIPPEGDHLKIMQYLDKQFNQLLAENIRYELGSPIDNRNIVRCLNWPAYLAPSEVKKTFRHYFSTGIAEYIVEEVEQKLIINMISQEFFYQEEQDIHSISHYCHQLLSLNDETWLPDKKKIAERKRKIYAKAYAYLLEDRLFDVRGFLRFRLHDYLQELKEVLEHAIDEYILDKEYKEFIRLIRYFIFSQKAKCPLLHLLHIEENQFLLFNEHKNIISLTDIEKQLQTWSGQKIMLHEGMIISSLTSMLPKKIVVHTLEPNLNVLHTLKQIFLERLILCTSCSDCKQWRKKELENK